MKKISLLSLTAFVALSTFTGCKKDDKEDPKPQVTKTDVITAKNWRVSADIAEFNGRTFDLYADPTVYEPCRKDDFAKFNTDKTVKFDEGISKCDPTDPQTVTENWEFTSNETKILFNELGGSSARVADLVELTETTLKIRYNFTERTTGGKVVEIITYTAL
ncbi:hypothetical protein [Hymenobacter weizhouensis]|uniref:hypothetical protein n=1 Tax=Hymenobacter sp. YIM 151500-1 TaxID=2987689 RepID=UPI002227F4B0|nr:hypothetical protein [Hymenobacter sp. YIM 151500-1]UYZ61971.1 hypothetical protein OIS53_13275 [Hymenobacter sp. YIM 151500-1]